MAQIFHRSTNFIARFSVFSFIFIMGFAVLAVLQAARSPYMTRQNITREQPVQFSHKHHVGDDGIDQMRLVFQASTLLMQWCVDCHRNPAPNLRSMDKVFAMDWKPGADQQELGEKFMKERKIRTAAELTSCSTCHR